MKFENKIPISITIGGKDVNRIRISGEVVWQKEVEPVDANYLYVENTYNGSNTISVKQTITGSPDSSLYAKTLQYSKDKTNWSTITLSSTAYNINLNQGEKVYFRGNEGVLNYYANDGAIQAITNILGTQTHTIGGNINTLVNYITPNELTLTQGVFAGLFQNNTTITSAENLTLPPSLDGSLPTFAYYLMFSGCSTLITPPSEIPATKQGHASCSKMFLDCTQLKTPPALKSTILGNYCFTSIFKNCTSLISAPELPALTLTQNCYQAAFEGCTSLVNPPALPATEMKPNCYRNLFYGCTSLVNPPELPATTLAEGCYRSLFFNCSSLNSITVYADDISANNCTNDWLSGVASSGTFNNMGSATYTINSASGIPSGWTEKKPDYLYVENTYAGSNTITFTTTQSGTPASGTYATSVECSKDKLTWNTINFDTLNPQTITLEQGEKLYLRNNTGVFNFHDVRNGTVDYYTSITSTNTINVGGNTNSLFDYTNMSGVDVSSTVGGLCRLFNQSVNLVNAKDIVIPQTTYPDFFLDEMFNHCESLVTTPNLNNVVNIGYASCSQMFGYCYSLVTPPDFNSVTYTGTRSGFSWCFHDCNSLTRTPSFNSLTSIGPLGFNQTFTNCSNLTDIMFDTSSITNLPESAFNQSFMNTKIETGLHLGNVTELGKASLYKLYANCSFLSVVYCPNVSSWDESITRNWLSGAGTSVSGTKTAYKYSNISIPTSNSGIPTGWTVVNSNEPDYFYVENTYNGNNNIYVKTRAGYSGTEPTGEFATTLEYSKDKTNWTTINLDYDYYKNGSTVVSNLVTNLTLSLSVGEKVYFRNTSGYFGYVDSGIGTHSHQFSSDENIKAGGNIKSLLDYRDMVGTTMKKGCFYEMFFEAKKLTDASELILPDTVADSCYLKLFSGCSSLTSIPSLPALTMAPKCYCEMLKNTAITTPPELPSTKLAPYCYRNLFENCYSLTSSPELPATTMVEGCYQGLFNSCTHLTTSPVLSAKTLAKYSYRYMFNGCLRLNSVTSYADNINAEECTRWWLESVASSGTLHNLGSATYVTDSGDGIPTGWTEVKS